MGKGAKTKGYIKNLTTGDIKKFIYNPSSFSTDRGTTFMEVSSPGSSYPHFQYASGGGKTISVDLFLDDISKGDTKGYITFLEQLCPEEASNSSFKKPPQILFAFGSFMEKCVVTDLKIEYTSFDTSLNPTQATATLKLGVIK